ncbi:unnamed protein product [Staurois parvus]|uniref:Uncharacterized protein n=1 Tax=Staurois parvus TaxID=386267 RepID=A0ABN9DXB8_9NEOB|nr:unnamed protein product [Staurois parvus]
MPMDIWLACSINGEGAQNISPSAPYLL